MILAIVGLAGAGAGVWALTGSKQPEEKGPVIPKEFTVDALKKVNPEEAFDKFREIRERTDLTEEQREKIRENADQVREQMMDERLKEYFSTPKADRNKVLDKQIDELEKMRNRFEE